MKDTKIIIEVAEYYTSKLKQFGACAKGVDWNSEESQNLRFAQLIKLIPADKKFSVLDFGCGFGSLFSYLKNHFGQNCSYYGFDIAQDMINEASKLYKDSNAKWFTRIEDPPKVDYVIASGIFNVRLENSDEIWGEYILQVLNQMDRLANKGIAFNMLTSYSDREFMKDYLYYASPTYYFDYCKSNFSKYVSLNHDYPLYEFTIIILKNNI